MSDLEDTFALHLRVNKLTQFEREYRFHPSRKWRFDFAAPRLLIAVEIEGGIFGKKSAHNTGTGILRDMEKSNEAQRLGWRVFRFAAHDIKSGRAVKYIRQVIDEGAA